MEAAGQQPARQLPAAAAVVATKPSQTALSWVPPHRYPAPHRMCATFSASRRASSPRSSSSSRFNAASRALKISSCGSRDASLMRQQTQQCNLPSATFNVRWNSSRWEAGRQGEAARDSERRRVIGM